LLALCAAVLLLAGEARAQAAGPSVPGEELTVHLLTMGYGAEVWQNFGHNAIRVQNSETGEDFSFNYGMFSFDEPGFLSRFLRGRMRYWMAALDTERMLASYIAENRTVWQQELNLTPDERAELWRFLVLNAREENRFYRYEYFRDNCSTRVRDALDRALGGVLSTQLKGTTGALTYRSESLRLTSANLPIYTGIDLGLGPSNDVPLSAWEEGFIPMRLRDHVRNVTVRRPDGNTVPLVLEERVLFEATRPLPPDTTPQRRFSFLSAGILIAALIWGLGRFANSNRVAALCLATVLCVWALANGLFGLILTGLWAFTDHAATYGNENLFQTNPVAIVLVIAGPLAVLSGRARTLASALAWTLAGLSVVGLLLLALPWFDQSTGRIILLMLPIHLVVALTLRIYSPGTPSPRGDTGERAWRARAARAQGRHR
jgi:hypothetical protein